MRPNLSDGGTVVKRLLLIALGLAALPAVRPDGASARAAPPVVVSPAPLGPVAARPLAADLGLGRVRRFGPYATLTRANQVANYFRLRGYPARVVYVGALTLGTRAYGVKVWY